MRFAPVLAFLGTAQAAIVTSCFGVHGEDANGNGYTGNNWRLELEQFEDAFEPVACGRFADNIKARAISNSVRVGAINCFTSTNPTYLRIDVSLDKQSPDVQREAIFAAGRPTFGDFAVDTECPHFG